MHAWLHVGPWHCATSSSPAATTTTPHTQGTGPRGVSLDAMRPACLLRRPMLARHAGALRRACCHGPRAVSEGAVRTDNQKHDAYEQKLTETARAGVGFVGRRSGRQKGTRCARPPSSIPAASTDFRFAARPCRRCRRGLPATAMHAAHMPLAHATREPFARASAASEGGRHGKGGLHASAVWLHAISVLLHDGATRRSGQARPCAARCRQGHLPSCHSHAGLKDFAWCSAAITCRIPSRSMCTDTPPHLGMCTTV